VNIEKLGILSRSVPDQKFFYLRDSVLVREEANSLLENNEHLHLAPLLIIDVLREVVEISRIEGFLEKTPSGPADVDWNGAVTRIPREDIAAWSREGTFRLFGKIAEPIIIDELCPVRGCFHGNVERSFDNEIDHRPLR
jgi:hypothetical protein